MILRFQGPPALSDFRTKKKLADLRVIEPMLVDIGAFFVYLVETSRSLTDAEHTRLVRILDTRQQVQRPKTNARSVCRLIVPRIGTISPWSSKATDIARRCGLKPVTRIERGIEYYLHTECPIDLEKYHTLEPLLYDQMTQSVLDRGQEASVFQHAHPGQMNFIPLMDQGKWALLRANHELGLALSQQEIDYLEENFTAIGKNPSDVELMMFAQANSEHCRHKIFNAAWIIDDELQNQSLFGMIRYTSQKSPIGILSAYKDNAAVIEGPIARLLFRRSNTHEYSYREEAAHLVMKVETHNHPTAICPYPGAATGSGGEIRDEAAAGRGAATKAGLVGFSVSHLRIPGFMQPWEEEDPGRPKRLASALDIMIQGPLGSAAFNNEFGRPTLCGYFRTFEQKMPYGQELRGYHKPIMLAGGIGHIRIQNLSKEVIPVGAPIIVLGGPALLIGLGGGAASSIASGENDEVLDFASVQRDNPEMQRRCQEVIHHCASLGEENPILSLHDVGAGGLANAVPELLHSADRGGRIELRDIPSGESALSPMQLWCNESQERYVLALRSDALDQFRAYCERERCPFAVIGYATEEKHLIVSDRLFRNTPVHIPMALLFGKAPKMQREATHTECNNPDLDTHHIDLSEAVKRVLRFPAVADKSFLIHIGDRSVGGLVVRDPMVGPWQIPVSDLAVTATGFHAYTGEAMALGERAPLALIDAPASGRMAIGEALTNLAAARIVSLRKIKLSANWMAAAGTPEEDACLFDTVKAVGMQICPSLGIAIPVGKDSLSMKTVWKNENDEEVVMKAPLSLVVTAYAPVADVRATLTPMLQLNAGPTCLLLIDLGQGRNRLGGSALVQVYEQLGNECPDLDDTTLFKSFFSSIQGLNADQMLLAYHDRSDGGLFVTLCEMAFAARCGLEINVAGLGTEVLPALFTEELGAVIQVRERDLPTVIDRLTKAGLGACLHFIGIPREDGLFVFRHGEDLLLSETRAHLHSIWSETSYKIRLLRDHPECVQQEYHTICDNSDPGLSVDVSFDLDEDIAAPYYAKNRPYVAILREQGVNGHWEMAAAFDRAGFTAVDVHMSDLLDGRIRLDQFVGLAVCGGFSYGDVLGAGGGWAKSILLSVRLRDEFHAFFHRQDTFTLGVCNGCQMLSYLAELIPGAAHWPHFVQNTSERFESRWVLVQVDPSPSILLKGMEGSKLPVVIAHGEGKAEFKVLPSTVLESQLVSLRYTDHYGYPTESFPYNPNGSPLGITGITTTDGRVTVMMPHPERGFRTIQNTWYPHTRIQRDYGPWMRLFRNARQWVA